MVDWNELIKDSGKDIRRLDHVIRFSSIPVAVSESVATHSYWVALYSAMIQKAIGDDGPMSRVLLHAITHDLMECVTGDVVRTFKYSSQELRSAISDAEDQLAVKLPRTVRLVLPAESSDSMEKHVQSVVKAADFLSLFHYMKREVMRHNLEIQPFYNRMIDDFSLQNSKSIEETEFGFKPKEFYAGLVQEATVIRNVCYSSDQQWMNEVGMQIV